MHELSIALSIVDVAEEEMRKNGGTQVTAVHLKLGVLSGVVREALLSAYGLATEGTALAGSSLVIEDLPVIAHCAKCDAPRAINSIDWFICPECQSPISDVLQGREMQVVAMEIQ
ncbi:MAG: hydrogenase maturation nickel metallochaperone HypA [Bryobacteraceae bacterium]